MGPEFVKLKLGGDVVVFVAVNHVTKIDTSGTGCHIYVVGQTTPIYIRESADNIVKLFGTVRPQQD